MRWRFVVVIVCGLLTTACGGGPKASSADVLTLHQPTPDPTLDAVVKDLPRALAGVMPTPTPTPLPVIQAPAPKVTKPAVAPTLRPTLAPAPKPAVAPTARPTLAPTVKPR